MGNVAAKMLSNAFVEQMVNSFINTLQEEGLDQLKIKEAGFSFNKWSGSQTFGFKSSRNASFKTLLDFLHPLYKQGIVATDTIPGNVTLFERNYINAYLTDYVMQCLLNTSLQIPKPAYTGLTENRFKDPIIPKYSQNDIKKFQDKWSVLKSGKVIDINTENESEQEVLSAILADKVIKTIQAIDIPTFVASALKAFQAKEKQAELLKNGLFAQTGDSALEKGRASYSEEDQKQDTIKRMQQNI